MLAHLGNILIIEFNDKESYVIGAGTVKSLNETAAYRGEIVVQKIGVRTTQVAYQ